MKMEINTTTRTKNFTKEEKELMINLALKYNSEIENKKTDSGSLSQKHEAWENFTKEFNANSSHKRTSKQLRAYYRNTKSNLKKDIAADKIETFRTGGGTAKKRVDENNPLLAIVAVETTPIENKYDSSADYLHEEIVNIDESSDCEIITQVNIFEEDEIIIDESNDLQCNSSKNIIDKNVTESSKEGRTKKQKTNYKRQRRTNEELRSYVEEIGALKKEKLETEIEKNRMKTKVYYKKLEVLENILKERN